MTKKKGAKEILNNPGTSKAGNEGTDGKTSLCYRVIQIFALSHKS